MQCFDLYVVFQMFDFTRDGNCSALMYIYRDANRRRNPFHDLPKSINYYNCSSLSWNQWQHLLHTYSTGRPEGRGMDWRLPDAADGGWSASGHGHGLHWCRRRQQCLADCVRGWPNGGNNVRLNIGRGVWTIELADVGHLGDQWDGTLETYSESSKFWG